MVVDYKDKLDLVTEVYGSIKPIFIRWMKEKGYYDKYLEEIALGNTFWIPKEYFGFDIKCTISEYDYFIRMFCIYYFGYWKQELTINNVERYFNAIIDHSLRWCDCKYDIWSNVNNEFKEYINKRNF